MFYCNEFNSQYLSTSVRLYIVYGTKMFCNCVFGVKMLGFCHIICDVVMG